MPRRSLAKMVFGAGLTACALSGCVTQLPTPAPPQLSPRSALSVEYTSYYASRMADFQRKGLMRTERAPTDAPFDARKLSDDFNAIALNNEYSVSGTRLIANATPSPLRRWEMPVRFGLLFGASVSAKVQAEDQSNLIALISELSQATGHPMGYSEQPNFHVLVLNEHEIRAIGDTLRGLIPTLDDRTITYIQTMPKTNYCAVAATGPSMAHTQAIAIIRAEQPALLRQACLHEELAQGLGLANDSPRARPSIFNDDKEFALLTTHDTLLLRILYDPRLRTGMQPEEAAPIARLIAQELLGETT